MTYADDLGLRNPGETLCERFAVGPARYTSFAMSILTSLRYHMGLARAFGPLAMMSIGVRRRLRLRGAMTLRWKGQPIMVRPRESDPVVASAVLGWSEYGLGAHAEGALAQLAARWRARGGTPVIIDGGANVGYAALYFARTFPDAVIIAVEPNIDTFRVLQKNCAGHPQIRPVLGALWSHRNGVSLHSDRDLSWADTVRDGGDTPSLLLQDLVRSVPGGMPLIIKLDIEGAENEVCRASPELLRRTACLLVEPHDYLKPGSACLSPLYDALRGQSVDTLLVGEYIALIASGLLKEPQERPERRVQASPVSPAVVPAAMIAPAVEQLPVAAADRHAAAPYERV
jgi:FkbM family methyltransferase